MYIVFSHSVFIESYESGPDELNSDEINIQKSTIYAVLVELN